MCFSAEASFTVGTILSVVGITTLKQVKKQKYFLVALFPLFFASQQLIEGIVWLNMHPSFVSTPLSQAAVNLYLFFAWLFWPIFVPIAFFVAEKEKWKKILFLTVFLIGLIISYIDIIYLINYRITPQIVGRSLDYGFTPLYGNILYGLIVFIPIFLSSVPRMKIFGISLLIAFIISQLIYTYAFTSVWCFFCAAISIQLYQILQRASQEKKVS
ncbi:putative membrane protein [Waddlia chondrophila 2032/99]|uniref:Putative membrane protein n=1 Tax=Waddlia chondrophila 2032/99 TaxID=765953 RepID=F8LAI9_9BACT|nr:putative membrane protein [Waddlia chondrophila 2032/99]